MGGFHDNLGDGVEEIEDYSEDKYTPDYEDSGAPDSDANPEDYFEGDEEYEELEVTE